MKFSLRKLFIFLTKPLKLGILFSVSLYFLLRIVLVTNPLTSVILINIFKFFLPKFQLCVLYWLMWIRLMASEIFFSKLFTFVFSVLNFVFFITFYLIHHLIILTLEKQFSSHQHIIHLLLLLNYLNQLKH